MPNTTIYKSPVRFVVLTVGFLLGASVIAEAQQPKDQKAAPAQQSGALAQQKAGPAGATAAPAAQTVALPDADKVVLLVRLSLLTLSDALQTGNFSVLHDLGSPAFQASTTPSSLAQSFANLRALQIDMTTIALLVPQLAAPPGIDAQNRLRITGFFPGQPIQLNFDLMFEPVVGRWRMFALAVNAVPTPPAEQTKIAPSPAAPSPAGGAATQPPAAKKK